VYGIPLLESGFLSLGIEFSTSAALERKGKIKRKTGKKPDPVRILGNIFLNI